MLLGLGGGPLQKKILLQNYLYKCILLLPFPKFLSKRSWLVDKIIIMSISSRKEL